MSLQQDNQDADSVDTDAMVIDSHDATEEIYYCDGDETDADLDVFQPPVMPALQDSQVWIETLEKVLKTVVAVKFAVPCSFDAEPALQSEATGFIVDGERGYILTNRHVVGPGPFYGYAVLENHEEVDVHPLYRDPIHDFGILRFDPKAIKYMKISTLSLKPELAKSR